LVRFYRCFGVAIAAIVGTVPFHATALPDMPIVESGSFVPAAVFPLLASPVGREGDGRLSSRRAQYLPIVIREAHARGLPAEIADAVVQVESSYQPHVIGGVGEVGLMQVRPATAAMLGFRGTAAELADPETNVRYGVMYLARGWQLAKGDLCRTLMKYRAGHGEDVISPLSAEYCRRARLHLASLGWSEGEDKFARGVPASSGLSPDRFIADGVPISPARSALAVRRNTPVARLSGRREHPLLMASRSAAADALLRASGQHRSRAFWAEHDARMNAVRRQFAARDVAISLR
jgi:hypothetical protein